MDVKKIRKDFPILKVKVNSKPLVYLDNASTSQKPKVVIDAITEYYTKYNSNIHRGLHQLSEKATDSYEGSHEVVAKFINAEKEEIIFTKNTTESINLVAYNYIPRLKAGDEVILSPMEHHSNLVPWTVLGKKKGIKIRYIGMSDDGTLDIEHFKSILTERTRIVAIAHASNTLGVINPVKEITKIAHEKGAVVVVDGAQSLPHMPVDVKDLGCDFLAFSSHKMLGPTGIGVLYGKKGLLEQMEPFLYGGDMISEATYEGAAWNDLPWKFEAGTPNIAGGIAFAEAIKYLQGIGMQNIFKHEQELTVYALEKLRKVKGLTVYGPEAGKRVGVISFNLEGIHAHDVATLLDKEGIAIRAGHHCTMPLHKKMGIMSSCRASFYLYNTKGEIDKLCKALEKVKGVFRK